ncbi:hypothetical protein EIP86_011047, partial [Pleurotus ostreatoroseus]
TSGECRVKFLTYSQDGRYLISAGQDRLCHVWDVKKDQIIRTFGPLSYHDEFGVCLAYSPKSGSIAACPESKDHIVRVWPIDLTQDQNTEPLRHENTLLTISFSPDGEYIATGGLDRDICIWRVASHKKVTTARGHTGRILSLAYSLDGSRIVSGSDDHTIRVWDAQTGQALAQSSGAHSDLIWSVKFSPNGHFLLSSSRDRTMRVLDASTVTPVGMAGHDWSDYFLCASFSPDHDGTFIAHASADGILRVLDSATLTSMANDDDVSAHLFKPKRIFSMAWSPDSRFIATGDKTGLIHIWNVDSGFLVATPFQHSSGPIASLTYSSNGHFVISVSAYDGSLRIWDIQRQVQVGEPLRVKSQSQQWTATYSPDICLFASATMESDTAAAASIYMWDVRKGAAGLKVELDGASLKVVSKVAPVMAFSPPHGHYLACGTSDGAIWIWDTSTRGKVKMPHPTASPTASYRMTYRMTYRILPRRIPRHLPRIYHVSSAFYGLFLI